MAATVAAYADALKEVLTADELERQFYDQHPFLDRIEKTNRFAVGDYAKVPIHKGRSGGVSKMPAAGGTLNAADEQKIDSAEYDYTYSWGQIEIQAAAIVKTRGKANSVANVVDTEYEGMMENVRNQLERETVTNGDALIAQCTTTSGSTTVNLHPSGYGFDAIERGWLYEGLPVDIGTTGNEVLRGADLTIASVDEDSADPEIVVSSSVTTDSSDYVSIANARSGTTSYEANGLRNIVGSTTSSLGGLDPDTAGEEFWKPPYLNTTDTSITLDLMLKASRKVRQKTGKAPTDIAASLVQHEQMYKFVQAQQRFTGDSFNVGNVEAFKWNGSAVWPLNALPSREVYFLTLSDFFIVRPNEGPEWASEIEGRGKKGVRHVSGTTAFRDALMYTFNLATRRRDSHAGFTGLTSAT